MNKFIVWRCVFILASTLIGAAWLMLKGPFAVVRVTTILTEKAPFWYMLSVFPILGMLFADLFEEYARSRNRSKFFLFAIQIAIVVVISNARLGMRLPVSGHSLTVCYFMARRLLNNQLQGFYMAEFAFGIVTLGVVCYIKLFWWADPITLFCGAVVGVVLAIIGTASERALQLPKNRDQQGV